MRMAKSWFWLLSLSFLLATPAAAAEQPSLIGRQIEAFELQDYRGRLHRLDDYADSKVVIVAFLGTDCPLAKLYGPRMQELYEEFLPQGAMFLGINSNRQDSLTAVGAHARIHGIEFPVLKDVGNQVADQFGATRTPEIFVLDADRRVRYHGRIDDQYGFDFGVGYQKPKLERRDLATAVEELLAGREVSVPETKVVGCIIGRVREVDETAEVTYSNQIARILQNSCIECHREGQIAPFALTEYEDVAGWGEMIAEVVRAQRMPPWHANPAHGTFSNDIRLSDQEKADIYAWVEAGCPEGDAADLPEPREYAEGWMMPREPDAVYYIQDDPVVVPAEGVVDYKYFVVDPGFTEDKWVKVAECMPGNRQVVHHIIVFIQPPRQDRRSQDRDIRGFHFLSGFAPGTRPFVLPDGMAKRIPAGSKLVFQMHYTPCGSEQLDRSGVGLIFTDSEEVHDQVATTATSYHALAIPPHDNNYMVEASTTFERDTLLLSMFPHMHLRGKAFRYEAIYPDGTSEILLDVPQYDFNWQNSFILAEPKLLPKGTTMHCTAWFDNSADNLANPDPTETVRWGPQTWHEMMIGWYDVALPVDEAEAILQKATAGDQDAEAGGGEEAGG